MSVSQEQRHLRRGSVQAEPPSDADSLKMLVRQTLTQVSRLNEDLTVNTARIAKFKASLEASTTPSEATGRPLSPVVPLSARE